MYTVLNSLPTVTSIPSESKRGARETDKERKRARVSRVRGLEGAEDVNHVGVVCGHGQSFDLAVDELVL